MKPRKFAPGFRLSVFDIFVLCTGSIAAVAVAVGKSDWILGTIVGFVVLHFFLFCNVFRISLISELIWKSVFILLVLGTSLFGFPGWIATFSLSTLLGGFLIYRETKKESYHGIFWERWNPNLLEWWSSQQP